MNKTIATFLAVSLGAAPLVPLSMAGEYKLKQPSRFITGAGSRDPFWPIGVNDPGAEADALASAPSLPDLVVTSIFLGGMPRMATINGKAYGEGEFVSVATGKGVVESIFDGGVVIKYQGRDFTVRLKRK